MENLGGEVLIRCLITIPQPSEFIEVVGCWYFSFWKGGGGWACRPFSPLVEMLIMTLAGELKQGKYKAAVSWAGACTGTEADTATEAQMRRQPNLKQWQKCEHRAGI